MGQAGVGRSSVERRLAGSPAYRSRTTCINLRYLTGVPSLVAGL